MVMFIFRIFVILSCVWQPAIAMSIESGESVGGFLASDDQIDTYTFYAPEGRGYITVADTSSNKAVSPSISIVGPDNSHVGRDFDSGVARVSFPTSTEGVYTVMVSDEDVVSGDGIGSYQLHFVHSSAGSEGGFLSPGSNINGSLAVGDVDSWQYYARAGERFEVTLSDGGSGNPLAPNLIVFLRGSSTFLRNSGDSSTESRSIAADASGFYTIIATNSDLRYRGASGPYTLNVTSNLVLQDETVFVSTTESSMSFTLFLNEEQQRLLDDVKQPSCDSADSLASFRFFLSPLSSLLNFLVENEVISESAENSADTATKARSIIAGSRRGDRLPGGRDAHAIAASAAAAGGESAQRQTCNDPPRFDYDQVVQVDESDVLESGSVDPDYAVLDGALGYFGAGLSYRDASLTTIERLQGALIDGDSQGIEVQSQALANFLSKAKQRFQTSHHIARSSDELLSRNGIPSLYSDPNVLVAPKQSIISGEYNIQFVRSVFPELALTDREIQDTFNDIVNFTASVDDSRSIGSYLADIANELRPSTLLSADLVRRCNGRVVTVDIGAGDIPTSNADVIFGTIGNDIINGLGGDDTICGLGGNDIINCLLYTSPSPRDKRQSRMPSSA